MIVLYCVLYTYHTYLGREGTASTCARFCMSFFFSYLACIYTLSQRVRYVRVALRDDNNKIGIDDLDI